MDITLELVRDVWKACYNDERLARLYDRPHTPLEVCTRSDGWWKCVPPHDRVWTVLHPEVFPGHKLRVVACDLAEEVLQSEERVGRVPNKWLREAVDTGREYASGRAYAPDLDRARLRLWHTADDCVQDSWIRYACYFTTAPTTEQTAWGTSMYAGQYLGWHRVLQLVTEKINTDI